MFESLLLAVLIAVPDTSFVAAEHAEDLTGDGTDEVLILRASGDPADSLKMVLTIESQGRELYRDSFIVDRIIGFDAGRRRASDAEWTRLLGEFYGSDFFSESRFRTPRETVAGVRRDPDEVPWGLDLTQAEWSALLNSGLPAFRYSPGGDALLALAWHADSQGFVDVMRCC